MAQSPELSFLPDDYLERKAQRRTNAVCGILFLAVMGGIGAAFTLSERATHQVDAAFTHTEGEYLTEAKRIQQVRDMQDKQKRMAQQAELSASLLERVPRYHILAEVTRETAASTVSLLDFQLDARPRAKPVVVEAKTAYEAKKAARATAAGTAAAPPPPEPKLYDVVMKITGVADTDVQVAQFLSRLGKLKLFREVNLVISDEYVHEDTKLRKFQIELMLDPTTDLTTAPPEPNTQTTAVEIKE